MTAAPRIGTLVRKPLLLRLRTRLRRDGLDEALASGAAPESSEELSLRASDLLQQETRVRIADCLRNLIEAAEEPPSTWGTHGIDPPLRGRAVLDARAELEDLAEVLSSRRPMAVREVACAAVLVWNPYSPIYSADACGDVAMRARQALLAPAS